MKKFAFVLLLVAALALVACGGEEPAPAGSGDAAAGEKLFKEAAQPPCLTCHSLEAGARLIGPALAGIGSAAGNMVSGLSAEAYLRQSIVEPNAYVVEGFSANLMPATYATDLSEQQVNDLVAFMLSLK